MAPVRRICIHGQQRCKQIPTALQHNTHKPRQHSPTCAGGWAPHTPSGMMRCRNSPERRTSQLFHAWSISRSTASRLAAVGAASRPCRAAASSIHCSVRSDSVHPEPPPMLPWQPLNHTSCGGGGRWREGDAARGVPGWGLALGVGGILGNVWSSAHHADHFPWAPFGGRQGGRGVTCDCCDRTGSSSVGPAHQGAGREERRGEVAAALIDGHGMEPGSNLYATALLG